MMVIFVDQFKALGFPASLPLRKLHGAGGREEEERREEKGTRGARRAAARRGAAGPRSVFLISKINAAREQKKMEDKVISPEKAEEAKLKARYPHLGQKPGGSDFLRKRLQKGQKYFDSGDYNMAKAKMKNKQLPTAAPDKTEVTGDHIPTPQDLPQRKPSLVASKLAG